jgi:anti-sigma regulatory factor (Ser/Thr protein kinase)
MDAARARKRLVDAAERVRLRPEKGPAPRGGDELQELAETFRRTVDRLSSLVRDLESAHAQALEAEVEKKQFYRDVLRAVTLGRFELVDAEEIPEPGAPIADLVVRDTPTYAAARAAIREAAQAAGISEERGGELVLAAGEAVTNALKHAGGGRCCVYREDGVVAVRITDAGAGIRSQDLPAAILTPGFSTKVSLGMGYTLMLKLCDRVWLGTGPAGTVVQLEKRVQPPPPEDDMIARILQRM